MACTRSEEGEVGWEGEDGGVEFFPEDNGAERGGENDHKLVE